MVVCGSAWRAAIWTSRRSTPASSIVVTECMAEHMRVRPGNPYSGDVGQAPQAPGGGVAVHPRAAAVEQDRPVRRVPAARSMARLTAGGSGTRTTLLL